jgi:hypothetical protein
VTQLVTLTAGGETYKAIGKVYKPAPFTMFDGQMTTLTGSFEDVPPKTLSIDFKRSAFAGLAKEIHPSITLPTTNLYAYSESGGATQTAGLSPTVLDFSSIAEPVTDFAGDLSYGNPFPSAWGLVASGRADVTLSVMLPGAASPNELSGSVYCRTLFKDGAPVTLAPRLGPVKNILVNGQATVDWLKGAGLKPTVSFSPPATGTAKVYHVLVRKLDPKGTSKLAGSVSTPETSVVLPDGILKAGGYYYVRVVAHEEPLNLTDRSAPVTDACFSTAFTNVIEP